MNAEDFYNKNAYKEIDFNNAEEAQEWIHSPEFVVEFAERYHQLKLKRTGRSCRSSHKPT